MNTVEIPPPAHFRPGLFGRIGVIAAALFIGALTLFMLALVVPLLSASLPLAVVLGGMGILMASLTALVAKEAVARQRLRASIIGGSLTARLPKRRGFISQEKQSLEIPLGDIARIETRMEFFEGLGVTTGQRAWRLVRRNGEHVDLGADRDMLPPFFGPLVDAIVSRTGAPVEDRGAVDGDAGFLLVAGQGAPDWAAPSLSPAAAKVRARKQARTALLIGIAALLVILARAISER